MKNFINYYYNFDIHNIYFSNEKYFFDNDKIKYVLELCYNPDISSYYYELESQLEKYKYFFTIILNRENNYITWIEGKPYVLLKIGNINNEKISVFDIKNNYFIEINNKLSIINRFPWIKLWENKIDYFEEWLFLKQEGYKKIYPLFHYFVGIAENALLYLKESEIEEKKEQSDQLVISHNRLSINDELYDYYDSSNIIIDHASRDIGEYIKSMFLYRVWDLDLIKQYLKKQYFSRYGIRVLFARILFPSFFFDYLEKMITNNSDIDLLYLESRVDEFQSFIKDIALFFYENYSVRMIPWIIKKT